MNIWLTNLTYINLASVLLIQNNIPLLFFYLVLFYYYKIIPCSESGTDSISELMLLTLLDVYDVTFSRQLQSNAGWISLWDGIYRYINKVCTRKTVSQLGGGFVFPITLVLP